MADAAPPWGRGWPEALVWALHSALLPNAARAAALLAHLHPEPSTAPAPPPDVLEVPNLTSARALHAALNALRPGGASFASILATLESGDLAPYEGQQAALVPLLALVAHLRAQGDGDAEERVARVLLRLERRGLAHDAASAAPPVNRTLHALRTHTLRVPEDGPAARLLNLRLEQHEAAALHAAAAAPDAPPALRTQAVARHVRRAAHYAATRAPDAPLVALHVRAAAALASAAAPPPAECTEFLAALSLSAPALRAHTALLLASLLRNPALLSPARTAALLAHPPAGEAPRDPAAHSSLLVACAAYAAAAPDTQRATREWLEHSLRASSPPTGAQLTAAVFVLSDEPRAAHAARLAQALAAAHAALRPAALLPLFRVFRSAANERLADAAWPAALVAALLPAPPPPPAAGPAALPLPLLVIAAALARPPPAAAPPALVRALLDELMRAPSEPAPSDSEVGAEAEALRLFCLLEAAVALPAAALAPVALAPLVQRALAALHAASLPLELLAPTPPSLAPLERHAATPLFSLAAPLSRALAALLPRLSAAQRAPCFARLRARADALNTAIAPHLALLLSPRAAGRRAAVRLLQAEQLVAVVLASAPADAPPPCALSPDECADVLDALAALDFFRAPLPAFSRLLLALAARLADAAALDALVARQCAAVLAAPPRDLLPSSRAAFYLLFARAAAPRLRPALVLEPIAPAVADALRRGDAISRAAHSTAAALVTAHGALLAPVAPYLVHCSLGAYPAAAALSSLTELLRAVLRAVPADAPVLVACAQLPPRVAALYADGNAHSARLLAVAFLRLLLQARLSLLAPLQRLVCELIERAPVADRPGLVRTVQALAAASLDYQRKQRLVEFYHTHVLPLALASFAPPPAAAAAAAASAPGPAPTPAHTASVPSAPPTAAATASPRPLPGAPP